MIKKLKYMMIKARSRWHLFLTTQRKEKLWTKKMQIPEITKFAENIPEIYRRQGN